MATELRTENAVIEALRRRYAPPAWALFSGVSNGTGSSACRWADAIAMSIWPSRGLELVGFEVKTDRSDLLRELKDPSKANAVGRYCDRWWIAAGSKQICQPNELPAAWGLLIPHGKSMKIVKDATKLECDPIDRTFLAAILRRASEQLGSMRGKIRAEIYNEVHSDIETNIEARYKRDLETLHGYHNESKAANTKLQNQIRAMTDSGLQAHSIGQAIQLLHRLTGWKGSIRNVDDTLQRIARDRDSLNSIEATMLEAKAIFESIHPQEEE